MSSILRLPDFDQRPMVARPLCCLTERFAFANLSQMFALAAAMSTPTD